MVHDSWWWVLGLVGTMTLSLTPGPVRCPDVPRAGVAGGEQAICLQYPGPDKPILNPISISANPSTVNGGESFQCTISFTDTVSYDRTVALDTDHPEAFADLPVSVVVPAQSNGVTFTVQTNTVSETTVATILGTHREQSGNGTVTVNP